MGKRGKEQRAKSKEQSSKAANEHIVMLVGKKNLSGDKKQAFNACIYVGKKESFSIPPLYHTRMLLVVPLATDYEISMAGLSIRRRYGSRYKRYRLRSRNFKTRICTEHQRVTIPNNPAWILEKQVVATFSRR